MLLKKWQGKEGIVKFIRLWTIKKYACYTFNEHNNRIGPLGQVGLLSAMSVCLFVCLSVCETKIPSLEVKKRPRKLLLLCQNVNIRANTIWVKFLYILSCLQSFSALALCFFLSTKTGINWSKSPRKSSNFLCKVLVPPESFAKYQCSVCVCLSLLPWGRDQPFWTPTWRYFSTKYSKHGWI